MDGPSGRPSTAGWTRGLLRGRRLWALLAVAAVLAVHGVQCTGEVVAAPAASLTAATSHGSSHGAVPSARDAHSGAVTPSHGSHHGAATPSVDGTHGSGAVAHPPTGAAPDGAPVHGADVWTLCLAVLFAALTWLGVATLRRGWTALPLRGPPRPVLRHLHRPAPAPDLASLCLLRI